MKILSKNLVVSLALFALAAVPFFPAKADDLAYALTNTGQLGTLDLANGAFTLIGTPSTLGNGVGLGVFNGGLYTAVDNGGVFGSSTLWSINPTNGSATLLGPTGITILNLGSTTPIGLFAVGVPTTGGTPNLYFINPVTAMATLIGSTGLLPSGTTSLSTSPSISSALYFSDGPLLYTLSVVTGAATLVGPFGPPIDLGGMVQENGTLYGGQVSPTLLIDTLNPTTGTATPESPTTTDVVGLAPDPLVTQVPEPSSVLLFAAGLLPIVSRLRRK
jgi:hypothetical protein